MEMRQKKIVKDERMKELCKRHSIAFRAKKAKGERRKKRKITVRTVKDATNTEYRIQTARRRRAR
jgi:hypothetical protein